MSRQARRSGRLAVTWCLSVTPSAVAVAAINGGARGASLGESAGAPSPSHSASICTAATTAIASPLVGPPAISTTTATTNCGGPSSCPRPSTLCILRIPPHLSGLLVDSPISKAPVRFPASRRSFFPFFPPSLSRQNVRSYHVYCSDSNLPSGLSSAVLHLAPTLTRRRLRKLVVAMGHSHSHGGHSHHNHDNSYLVSAKKNDPGVRITRIGLLSNLLMAIAKFIGGWTFNSKAMVADAWHSIADMASDILTLATVSWSIKPPSDRFPLGLGKVESLGSLGVSGMLLVGGVYMGWDSAISLFAHFDPERAHDILEHVGHGHGHSHSHNPADLGIPSVHAAWLAAGTILIKEWLYRATMKVARERKSSVLASNAIHHRVDSLTGIVTMAAIVGANAIDNAAWLDPVGGLLISIMVIHAGFDNTKSALYELIDQTIDADVKGAIRKQAQSALVHVSDGHEAELRDVSGVKSGQNYLVDLEMAVPAAWNMSDLADVENAVRTEVGARVRGVRRVRIRFVSKDAPVNEKFDEFVYTNLDADPEDHKHENGANEDHDHKH
ncbi:hypothetical protein MY5147_001035 [Beauveria neobassiana]|uniref:Metal transporter 2 n=1 Tax=Beauveria bassiana D1-5 TaxID=1245745 RepID=A0A0A2VXG5_BEABA|nr:metal transporter 2 [Beauveria bassiana D1-5]